MRGEEKWLEEIAPKIQARFGFTRLPFRKDLRPDEWFPTEAMGHALGRLRYLVERCGIGCLTGDPGLGKSTVLRVFMASLNRGSHMVCDLTHTTCGVLDLTRALTRGFGLEPGVRRSDMFEAIKAQVVQLTGSRGFRVVLVVDESHLLPVGFLDELRILASFDSDGEDRLAIVLAGQLQLEATLRLAVNEAFAQRVVVRQRLEPWKRDEVGRYLQFRLARAGRNAKLFLPDAVEAIAKAAQGVPRLVDRLAEHALLLAYEGGRKEVDAALIEAALAEVDGRPLES